MVARIEELEKRIDEGERELAALTPEECRATAEFARAMKPRFRSERQRELVEEIAQEFDERATGTFRGRLRWVSLPPR